MNECEQNIAGCEQQCINTNGSFVCDCDRGYEVNVMDSSKCGGRSMHNSLVCSEL